MQMSLGQQVLSFFFWKLGEDTTLYDTIHEKRLLWEKREIGLSILSFSGAFVSQQ